MVSVFTFSECISLINDVKETPHNVSARAFERFVNIPTREISVQALHDKLIKQCLRAISAFVIYSWTTILL